MAALQARFVARCAGDLERLRELANAGEPGTGEMRLLAHSLAGAGATFGFPGVSTAAGLLDDAFVAGQAPSEAEVGALIAALEAVVTPAS